MADSKEKIDIKFTPKMIELMKKKEQSVDNLNPISEYHEALLKKEDKDALDYIMNLMLTDDSLARVLQNPNILRQMVNSQGLFPIEYSVAERLVNEGFATSEALEKQREQKSELATDKKDDSVPTETIEEAGDQKKEENEAQRQFAPEKDDNTTPEIKAMNDEIEKLENAEREKKDDPRTKELIQNQVEQVANKRNEMYGKFFYLTPERMLDNLKHVNNGDVWRKITRDQSDIAYAIERAYRTCSDPSLLQNPTFLKERLDSLSHLPGAKQVSNLKSIHMMALSITYVGYHEEEVSADKTSESEVHDPSNQQVDKASVEFPMFADQLPYSIKKMIADMIRQKEKEIIGQRVLQDPSQTDFVLNNMDLILDTALLQLEEMYGRDQIGKGSTENAIAAYIRMVRETKENGELNVPDELDSQNNPDSQGNDNTLEINDEMVSTDSGRQELAQKLKALSPENPDNNSLQSISKLSINIVISSENDIETMEKTVSELKDVGVPVEIYYALSPSLGDNLDSFIERVDRIPKSGSITLVHDKDAELGLAVDNAITGAIESWAMDAVRVVAMQELGEAISGPLENIFAELLGRNLDRDYLVNVFNEFRSRALDLANEINNKEVTPQQAIDELSRIANVSINETAQYLRELGAEIDNEEQKDPFAQMFST